MTDKQMIKLKPTEDLDEKIIKEKGNTKCIFYSDDECRSGDRTRDCVNCARVKYHSLYSLNWDNQERLQKIIKQKEQECEELKKQLKNKTEDLERHQNHLYELGQTILSLGKDLKTKEQECERLKSHINCICFDPSSNNNRCISYNRMAEDYERDLKQLDQLKKENETYKSSIVANLDKSISKRYRELLEENDQLKVENEESKRQLETKGKILKLTDKAKNEYSKENSKLKQTLTEIKEIINEFAKEDILTFPDFSKEKNYELIQKQCGGPILKILQKINEVEDVESN